MLRAHHLCGLLLLGACHSAPPSNGGAPAALAPSLEEIFLEPGLLDGAPRLRSVSADGRWAIVEHRPLRRDAEGALELAEDEGALLLSLEGESEARPLRSLLPSADADAEADEAPPLRHAWSRSGSRLALARGDELYLSREGAPAELRLRWRAPAVEPAEQEDEEAAEARTPRLGTPRFERDDSGLRVRLERALWWVPLDEQLPAQELSASIEASAQDLRWSDRRDVALCVEGGLEGEREDESEGEGDESAALTHVQHMQSGRRVRLEGRAEMDELDALSLSPAGRWVIGLQRDLSSAPKRQLVPDYLTERVSTETTRRERAEDGPWPSLLWVWSAEDGARQQVGVPSELAWLRPIGWAPRPEGGPERYALLRTHADWRARELWLWEEGELWLALTERHERWVGGPSSGWAWTPDGERLVAGSECVPGSTTPDRAQVWSYSVGERSLAQRSAVAGEVGRLQLLPDGSVLFAYTEADPGRRRLGRLSAAALAGEPETGLRTYASPSGWIEEAQASADGARVVIAHQTLGQPSSLWVLGEEEAPRPLLEHGNRPLERLPRLLPERIVVRALDGAQVHAHVYTPASSSIDRPDAARAAVVFVHGAGYLQNVSDSLTSYPKNLLFHERLARLGYVVVDVDYRGSRGYGSDFRTALQYHLGGLDLDDIHAVIDELARREVVDAERVGIYGGSYGGFLTLMALFTAPERWSAGAALRSVTDWRSYNPWYTQPRLGKPSTHPEAYERSSPIDHALALEDPLLLLHGLVDSNVFAQDTIRLMEALIDAGLPFDAMLYPSQDHAFADGPHWLDEYRRIEALMRNELGAPLGGALSQ